MWLKPKSALPLLSKNKGLCLKCKEISPFWKTACLIYSLLFFLLVLFAGLSGLLFKVDVNDIYIYIVYFPLLAIAFIAAYLSDSKGVAVLSIMTVIAMLPLIEYMAVFLVTIGGHLFIILKKSKTFISARTFICFFLLVFSSRFYPFYFITVDTVLEEKYSPDREYYTQEIDHDEGALGGSASVILYKEYINLGWIRISGQSRLLASGNWGKRFPVRWIDNETVSVGGRDYRVYVSSSWDDRIIGREKVYKREELLDFFSENKGQFEKIVEVLQKNYDFYTQKQSTMGEVLLAYNGDRDFFTEEEWADIEEFFYSAQPMNIKCFEDAAIAFRFAKGKEGFVYALLYTGDGEAEKHIDRYRTERDVVEIIDDQWWLVMRIFDL